jgi:hypothetical protein
MIVPLFPAGPLASGAQAGNSVFLAAMTVPHDQGMPLVPLFDVISKGFTHLLTADQGRSIVFGPVIMGGTFRSFAMARSRRSWLATVLVMPVSRMVTRIIARMASPASRFGSRGLTAAAVLASQRPNASCSASARSTATYIVTAYLLVSQIRARTRAARSGGRPEFIQQARHP